MRVAAEADCAAVGEAAATELRPNCRDKSSSSSMASEPVRRLPVALPLPNRLEEEEEEETRSSDAAEDRLLNPEDDDVAGAAESVAPSFLPKLVYMYSAKMSSSVGYGVSAFALRLTNLLMPSAFASAFAPVSPI